MKAQIDFFTDKLGMELVALYWMHGVENTWHGFLRLNDDSAIAFVSNPQMSEIPVTLGQSHAGNAGANAAPGTMQHVAFRVEDHETLLALRDRLRLKGVPVMGPVDHGFCASIYFAGPENLALELSYSKTALAPEAWIDPEVVALAGINSEELARYKAPPAFSDQGGLATQPALDQTEGPHLTNYPPDAYEMVMGLPDETVWQLVDSAPPVKLES
jgi:catechol 2,3-dioxygenase-like lactoylglutathione lyase family enzyme